jgi:hypothetical protein
MDIKLLENIPDTDSIKWIYEEKKDLYDKFTQFTMQKPEKLEKIIEKPLQKSKDKDKKTPIELIIEYTNTDIILKREIKDKLIETLGQSNYSKLFGLKKTSEMMTSITKDTWNQSIVLFISFLLERNIIYKSKSYLYNKEKNKGDIIINQ